MTTGDARPEQGSWRIVWRALRVGHVDDPRYEALTRQTADRNIRNGWLPLLLTTACAIQLTLVVVRPASGAEWSGTVAIAASALLLAGGACVLWVARRRCRRYLDIDGQHQPERQS